MRHLFAAVAACALALAGIAGTSARAADGVLIAAPNRVDVVHDTKRDVVYISSSDGKVLCYDIATGAFLPAIEVGGVPAGIDLSPDGDQLAVADRDSGATQVWVHVVNLPTLTVRKLSAPKDYYEGGTWSVAYAADGSLLTTSQYQGSGWVPMRRFQPALRKYQRLASVTQNTMLAPSADRTKIGFAESNISDGRWGVYTTATRTFAFRQWYQDGTSWFNFEIATSPTGTQFAIPTYGGTFLYNQAYAKVATIGEYAGGQPIAAAYHPTQNLVYFPWAGSTEVRVYDTTTFQQVDALDAGYTFTHTGNGAYGQGRTRISADGSLLMVTVDGGVRLFPLAP